jgi:transposase
MAYKPIRMDIVNQIRDLKIKNTSIKHMARILGISRNTVKKYLRKIEELNLVDQATEIREEHFYQIYSDHYQHSNVRQQTLIEMMPELLKTLSLRGKTREHIYQDYIRIHNEGYSYGEFCRKIKAYRRTLNATINIEHKPGEVMQLDYAGSTLKYYDPKSGECYYAQVLICTLPSSGMTFVIAMPSQSIPDFIHGITKALSYFGGCPKRLLCDNLKSFVTKPNRYLPTFSEAVSQLARHYGVELEATRVAKPKDKAHVERHVSIVYNNIHAHLHDHRPQSIEELNVLVNQYLEKLNNKKRTSGTNHRNLSRREAFDQFEKETLGPLPNQPFYLKSSTMATVQSNYHVCVGEDMHYYSVPYTYIGKKVQVVYTEHDVQIFFDVHRIAYHKRNKIRGTFSTIEAHRPPKHIHFLADEALSKDDFVKKASGVGPSTQWAMQCILHDLNPNANYHKIAKGLLSLQKHYSPERLEQVCSFFRDQNIISLEAIRNVIASNRDLKYSAEPQAKIIPLHNNIRGADYFN